MSKLRILVPIKRVIDFAIKPRVNPSGDGVITQGVKFSMNPFCEIAVEEAVRIREKTKDSKLVEQIHVVSAGSLKNQETLRNALARGADSSTLIETSKDENEASKLEPLSVAKLLAALVKKENYNLIILGKQAIDDDANQTGQLLGGLLNWPQATFASKVDIDADANSVTVTREVDGGSATLKAKLPLIITTDLRLNEPRYASLPNIMKAKKKPLSIIKPEDLGVKIESKINIKSVFEPPPRSKGITVGSVDELVSKLKERGAI